jgi:peptidoglycan/xylan/chitin deacetylase (PgdA/CDA1 family)
MLTLKNISLVFSIAAVGMIAWDIYYGLAWYFYALLLLTFSLLLFYGSYYIGSGFYIPVICSAKTDRKEIAITFDDGPAVNFSPGILDVLKKSNVPAAFFCIGKNIAANKAILKRIVAEGHIVGNHSNSHHFWFDLYSTEKMMEDMMSMSDRVFEVIGVRPNLFRPPYGVTNPNLAKAINKTGMLPVGWNIRSMDTVVKDDKKLLNKVLKLVKPGAILLFHDTSETTFSMLPAFIEKVKLQGYDIVRLDKLLNIAAYV